MGLDVLIAGGGISGLVTAYRLLQSRPGLELELLEASDRAGGTMGTESVDGFNFERGPNGFLDNVSHTMDLAREIGLEGRLLAASDAAKKRYLLKRGKLHPLPRKPWDLLFSPLLSFGGKLRVLAEPLQARGGGGGDESVAGFGRRRFGAEAAATFFDPIVTGIYAGDAERVSLAAAFPRLKALEEENGSILRGLIARARERRKAKSAEGPELEPGPKPGGGFGSLYSFERGLDELVQALSARLGSRLRRKAPVEEIHVKQGDGYEAVLRDRSTVRARAVVVAIPAPRAATLVSSWNPELAVALDEIPYAPVAVVCLGYRRDNVEHPLDGFGLLIPHDQGYRTLGVIFISSIFPAHAPEGMASLRVLVGGARDPEVVALSEGELESLVVREMGPVLGLGNEPVARRVYRYAQGIPQYNVGHSKRVRRIEGWLKHLPGFFVTGNAYHGVGMNDCVADGGRAAREVLQFLDEKRGAA